MPTEEEMLGYDAEDLSYSDKLVIFIVGDTPIMKTRLQKISLLFDELYKADSVKADYHAYFFGGYSDDIDESAENLVDMGILDERRDGYVLTNYGRKLEEYVTKNSEFDRILFANIDNIKTSLSNVSDRNVVGLTYHFYSDSAVNSTIKSSVDKMNGKSSINGVSLSETKKDIFEEYLRTGKKIAVTSR